MSSPPFVPAQSGIIRPKPLAAKQSGEAALCVRAQDVAPRLGAVRRFPRAQNPAPVLRPSLRDKGHAFRRGLLDQSLCGLPHRVAGLGLGLGLRL